MIYLDHAATTPVPRAVADAMYEVLTEQFGNPSSQYPMGLEMKRRVEVWRKTVADALGCGAKQLFLPPAARRRTTGLSPPPAGRTATWAATSLPPQWSTAPCWKPAAGWSGRDTR